MQRSTKKSLWIILTGLGLLLAASVLTACSFSMTGGITGVIGALALGAALLGLGASSSGCEASSCLSPPYDFSACLSPPLDAGDEVGPCLGAPLPDAAPDTNVGPCLGAPLPDAAPDITVGPCLTTRPPDGGVGALDPALEATPPAGSRETQRERAIARLADRLPRDVSRRLGSGDGTA